MCDNGRMESIWPDFRTYRNRSTSRIRTRYVWWQIATEEKEEQVVKPTLSIERQGHQV